MTEIQKLCNNKQSDLNMLTETSFVSNSVVLTLSETVVKVFLV